MKLFLTKPSIREHKIVLISTKKRKVHRKPNSNGLVAVVQIKIWMLDLWKKQEHLWIWTIWIPTKFKKIKWEAQLECSNHKHKMLIHSSNWLVNMRTM